MFNVGKRHLSLDRSASSLVEPANWKMQGWAQRREGMDKESFYPRAEHCPLTVVRSQDKGPRRPGVDTCEGAELQETNVRFSPLHSNPSTIWSSRLTLPPKCHGNLGIMLRLHCHQPGPSQHPAWTHTAASQWSPCF